MATYTLLGPYLLTQQPGRVDVIGFRGLGDLLRNQFCQTVLVVRTRRLRFYREAGIRESTQDIKADGLSFLPNLKIV